MVVNGRNRWPEQLREYAGRPLSTEGVRLVTVMVLWPEWHFFELLMLMIPKCPNGRLFIVLQRDIQLSDGQSCKMMQSCLSQILRQKAWETLCGSILGLRIRPFMEVEMSSSHAVGMKCKCQTHHLMTANLVWSGSDCWLKTQEDASLDLYGHQLTPLLTWSCWHCTLM